ncbi:MAG: hypothetical protein MUE51_16390, partial [Thermoleophilia bacterium]|nr:hypothetical protein [Thermoleophilia bacterium]
MQAHRQALVRGPGPGLGQQALGRVAARDAAAPARGGRQHVPRAAAGVQHPVALPDPGRIDEASAAGASQAAVRAC